MNLKNNRANNNTAEQTQQAIEYLLNARAFAWEWTGSDGDCHAILGQLAFETTVRFPSIEHNAALGLAGLIFRKPREGHAATRHSPELKKFLGSSGVKQVLKIAQRDAASPKEIWQVSAYVEEVVKLLGCFASAVNLNRWLFEQGHLSTADGNPPEGYGELPNTDYSKSNAYAIDPFTIKVRTGLPPEQRKQLCENLCNSEAGPRDAGGTSGVVSGCKYEERHDGYRINLLYKPGMGYSYSAPANHIEHIRNLCNKLETDGVLCTLRRTLPVALLPLYSIEEAKVIIRNLVAVQLCTKPAHAFLKIFDQVDGYLTRDISESLLELALKHNRLVSAVEFEALVDAPPPIPRL